MTVQAENLSTAVDPKPEGDVTETERLLELIKRTDALFVCDSCPTTTELLQKLLEGIISSASLRIFSSAPKKVESAVPRLKGRVATLPPPVSPINEGTTIAQELSEGGSKVFVGTPRPDPLFGIIDTRVEACLNWVAHARREAANARKEMEPSSFHRTESREVIDDIAEGIIEASFIDIIPRGGSVKAVMENAPFDAIKNGFLSVTAAPARAMVVGAGGKGYDDTLSSAVRTIWHALSGVRKSGSIVLMAECSEGLGSTALDMAATGRFSSEGGNKKEAHFDGAEDIFYLSKLRDEYDVLLLSGLPEVYAKSRLGLATARGSGEAVGRILNRLGRSGKMNVVTRAPECRIESV